MNETVLIKDQLILCCIHPTKGWMRRRDQLGYVLLAASLYDLAIMGKLQVNSGKIIAQEGHTGDPVLDVLLEKLVRLNGKRFSWLGKGFTMRLDRLYKLQTGYLVKTHQTSVTPVKWMGITWGKRYRVNRSGNLKQLMNRFDQVLIYGKKPSLTLALLIELLYLLNLTGTFFPDGELTARAKLHARDLTKHSISVSDDTLHAITKELRNHLRAAKATYQTWH